VEQRKKLNPIQLQEFEQRRSSVHVYNAMQLKGKEYIEIESQPTLNLGKELTISMWISPQSYDVPLLDRTVYSFSLISVWKRGYIELCVAGHCYLGSHPIILNEWTHVVAIFKCENGPDDHVRFFVNGVEDQSNFSPDSYLTEEHFVKENPLYIGHDHNNRFYQGLIDDVSLWSRAVSTKQAKALVYDVMGGSEEGLIGYWGFDQKPEKVVNNVKGWSTNGNVIGEPVWVESATKPLVASNCCL